MDLLCFVSMNLTNRIVGPLLASLIILGSGCTSNPPTPIATPEVKQPKNDIELNLSGTGLTKIPETVFSQIHLERLNVSNNALTGAPQAEIRHLQALKSLDLSDNKLTGLPAELGQLKNLQTLDVSNNALTGLPLELGNLTQLRLLDLSGNAYSVQDLEQISKKLPNTEVRR